MEPGSVSARHFRSPTTTRGGCFVRFRTDGDSPPERMLCPMNLPFRPTIRSLCLLHVLLVLVRADDWPQWRGPMRDGVWRETGIVASFPSPELKIGRAHV